MSKRHVLEHESSARPEQRGGGTEYNGKHPSRMPRGNRKYNRETADMVFGKDSPFGPSEREFLTLLDGHACLTSARRCSMLVARNDARRRSFKYTFPHSSPGLHATCLCSRCSRMRLCARPGPSKLRSCGQTRRLDGMEKRPWR